MPRRVAVHRRVAAPRRLRRRLAVSFAVVAAVASGALALGSYLSVRDSRLADSSRRAVEQGRLSLSFAAGNLPRQPTDADITSLLEAYQGGSFDTLLVFRSKQFRLVIRPGIDLRSVPPGVHALVGRGHLAYERSTIEGVPYLVVGGPVPGRPVQAFFFFSEKNLQDDLTALARVLFVGWMVILVLAGLVGSVLARQTLGPVARASDAARSMAEGLLDTRLPVAGRDEFGAWAESFNEMAEALEEKILALQQATERERRFTSDVAHELRTPLTALVGEASLLREHLDDLPPEARRPAQLLIADVARLRRLVEELMEISRLDSGREVVRSEQFDLTGLIDGLLRSRGWDGRVKVQLEPLAVDTDRRRVERIVGNLVGNALDHGQGQVWVRTGLEDRRPFVQVTDDGRGIPAEDLPHIFDRFYKADPSRTGQGSGLGLAIALENARLLGGDIEVWSQPGKGTRFTVRLPAASNAVTEPLHGGESTVPEPADHDRVVNEGGDRP